MHADRAPVLPQFVEDPEGPDAQRVQAAKPPAQLVANIGLPAEQPESIVDGSPQGPVKSEQREPGAARENDPSHDSTGIAEFGGPEFGELLP
jgi:hypothetical protein